MEVGGHITRHLCSSDAATDDGYDVCAPVRIQQCPALAYSARDVSTPLRPSAGKNFGAPRGEQMAAGESADQTSNAAHRTKNCSPNSVWMIGIASLCCAASFDIFTSDAAHLRSNYTVRSVYLWA